VADEGIHDLGAGGIAVQPPRVTAAVLNVESHLVEVGNDETRV